jgi:hypothetical protein
MITANFNLISSLFNPSADTLVETGVIVEVPKVGEHVVVNSTLYLVHSISWTFAQPDVSQNIAQTANIRMLGLPT